MAGSTEAYRRLSLKVCLLGDFAVGKTSLVRRFVYDRFDDRYLSTIGVKVSRKSVMVPAGETPVEVTCLLWDIAGNVEAASMQRAYTRGSSAGILVCDLTRAETLAALRHYSSELLAVNRDARFIVVANKADLVEHATLDRRQVEALAAELGAPMFVTSARTGDNVDAMFRQLAADLVAGRSR